MYNLFGALKKQHCTKIEEISNGFVFVIHVYFCHITLHKKRAVNVIKSTGNCGFGHIY